MRLLTIFLFLAGIVCCSTTERPQSSDNRQSEVATLRLQSPVNLETAIRTLPTNAVAGMSERGRDNYLGNNPPPGVYQVKERRIELFCDNAYSGIDADSMLFLRLFEDEQGRTIAASHSARPRNGSMPSERNTSVFRVEGGVWQDITEQVMPPEIPRDWYFCFNDPGRSVSCGAYVQDASHKFFSTGKPSHVIIWNKGKFRVKRKG